MQIEAVRKEHSALETKSAEATAKVKDLDAQRATLIKTHAKDRQTWETQLRAAQAAEKEARMLAAKAAARTQDVESNAKSAPVTGNKCGALRCCASACMHTAGWHRW